MNGRGNQIDTLVKIVTPENISFRYWLAGPARRVPAYLIDLVVQALLLSLAFWMMGFALGSLGLFGSFFGLYFVILFLVHWFYGGLLEAVWNGQTLGKRAMRIRVVTVHGQPIRAWQAVLRNVLRVVDAMPLGVRRTRKIGQDHEFERLRDYTVDDNHKWIDWRATARRNKLIVRDYQATQCQQIVFLIDGGRLMTNESAALTLLDHALNAMLMLSYVALRQGDQVGLIHFADDIDCFVPPRGGMRQMNRLLHASFDRFPRLVETPYDHAFRYLNGHCRKRSLVVLITSIIDEVNAAEFDRYLSNLVGRHLPLAVLLRDHRLFDAVAQDQPDAQQLWRYAAAADIIAWRHQVLTDLHSKGVLSVDVFPEQMTAPLVNRYLEIKARHLL